MAHGGEILITAADQHVVRPGVDGGQEPVVGTDDQVHGAAAVPLAPEGGGSRAAGDGGGEVAVPFVDRGPVRPAHQFEVLPVRPGHAEQPGDEATDRAAEAESGVAGDRGAGGPVLGRPAVRGWVAFPDRVAGGVDSDLGHADSGEVGVERLRRGERQRGTEHGRNEHTVLP